MKAILMTGYGNNDVLELREVERPVPGEHELLIEVAAASINPVDFKIRGGKMRLAKGFVLPIIFGNDLAGRVAAVGAGVARFRVGDEVFARVDKNKLGAFAEFATVHEDFAAIKPRTLDLARAAGVPLVALTAWQALYEAIGLKRGERIFIPAGAGAVGSIAVQLAKRAGAFVATSASGDGVAFARRLGADQVIDYKAEDPYAVLSGFDAVFDGLGGEALKRSFQVVKKGGRVVSIAGIPDRGALAQMGAGRFRQGLFAALSTPLRLLAAKHGATYRYLFMRPDGAQLAQIAALIDAGELIARTDRVFPLTQFKDAIDYVESGKAKGKVVLSFDAHG